MVINTKTFRQLLLLHVGCQTLHMAACFSYVSVLPRHLCKGTASGIFINTLGTRLSRRPRNFRVPRMLESQQNLQSQRSIAIKSSVISFPLQITAGFLAWSSGAEFAAAKDGAFGILESSTAGLLHPIGMFALYGMTVLAGYHGWQWRRAREIGQQISQLQKSGAEESAVKTLQQTRSALLSAGHKDSHVGFASIILAAGVALAVEGCFSTWWRVGELFPGEHIFAGAGTVLCWTLAASLSPWMVKGNDGARIAHIALNIVGFLLFTWQVGTGLEITINVFNQVPGW